MARYLDDRARGHFHFSVEKRPAGCRASHWFCGEPLAYTLGSRFHLYSSLVRKFLRRRRTSRIQAKRLCRPCLFHWQHTCCSFTNALHSLPAEEQDQTRARSALKQGIYWHRSYMLFHFNADLGRDSEHHLNPFKWMELSNRRIDSQMLGRLAAR